jgi:hypothetical protein
MLPAKEQPKTYMGKLEEGGGKVLKGFVTGGPLGGMAAGFGEGMKNLGEISDAIAYDAGGKVTDLTGSPALGFGANVATQAIPTLAGGLTGKLFSPAIQSGARSLMQSALKPSKLDHLSGRGARAVDTMLDEGVNVSAGGVAKLRSSIDDMNGEIADLIKNSSATVDKGKVASRLQDVMKKYEASVDANDLKVVQDAWTSFLSHPQLVGNPNMPIQFAQRMKQAGNAKLGDAAYGQGLKPAAERDSYKAIVRGLKEEIAAAEPAVAPLNARESALINAHKIAGNRVAMDANKNPIGLGALISQPWMVPLWMWDRSPLGKSAAARLLNSGAGPIGTGVGAGLGGLYGASQGQGLYP